MGGRTGLSVGINGALLITLAGCAALPGFAAGPAPGASTAPAPVVTKPIPVLTIPTPRPRTAAPALKTTGVAWPAILASLAGYGQWLLANPDPALVGTVAEPGCGMSNLISRQAAGLLGGRAYLKPSPPVFSAVVGPAAAAGNSVTLAVTASRPVESVLSRTGAKPITVFDALPPTDLLITLYRGADTKWRFCTVDPRGDTGAAEDPSVPLL
jgi:hypothetical protein